MTPLETAAKAAYESLRARTPSARASAWDGLSYTDRQWWIAAFRAGLDALPQAMATAVDPARVDKTLSIEKARRSERNIWATMLDGVR